MNATQQLVAAGFEAPTFRINGEVQTYLRKEYRVGRHDLFIDVEEDGDELVCVATCEEWGFEEREVFTDVPAFLTWADAQVDAVNDLIDAY